MGLSTIDRKILNETRNVAKNQKIRNKDIMEWSTSEEMVKKNLVSGETHFNLKNLGIHVAVKLPRKKETS